MKINILIGYKISSNILYQKLFILVDLFSSYEGAKIFVLIL